VVSVRFCKGAGSVFNSRSSSSSASAAIVDVMAKAELPPDIDKMIYWLADYARRYGGKLKFNEVDRFEAT
jgi:hypothetical protein